MTVRLLEIYIHIVLVKKFGARLILDKKLVVNDLYYHYVCLHYRL